MPPTFFYLFKMFIYFERGIERERDRERQRERERERWGRGRERGIERESQAGLVLSAWSPMWGLNSQTVRS